MNKIYMVKRNALGQSVVASELAKSKGKLSSVAKVVGLAILGLSSSAFAETTNEITTYGQDAIAQTGGTAIGVQAQADTNSTAIGQQATASTQATANGYVSAALANETIAIGVNSGAVGGSISKDDAKTLKEIDNKITEYSKETPPVDPLNAISPTEPVIKIEIIAVPIMPSSSPVETLLRDIDGTTEYQLLEIKNKLNLPYSKLTNNENAYKAFNENMDEFRQFITDSLSLNSITEMKAVTETSVKDIYTV
ncbi:ESPR-type extended signal peptide-containing protein [Actinobacillus porcinus]|uniref:ESPR-type extended signal peptide-containing protein n=1 Tax=Actinobacillus porcinus TaxID=51048 RepID=UPI002356148D|nr:ESPR-type extended signal peptide-containing protein [Actinobacillus porcinus]